MNPQAASSEQAQERFIPLGNSFDGLREMTWNLNTEAKKRQALSHLMNSLEALVQADSSQQLRAVSRQLGESQQKLEAHARRDPLIRSVVSSVQALIRVIQTAKGNGSNAVADAIEAVLLDVDYYRSQN